MLDATTMQGFKSAAKNLKKTLLDFDTEISQSSSLNILAKTLGVKNYNTISPVLIDKSNQIKSVMKTLAEIKEDVKKTTANFRQNPYVENIVDDYNIRYREYRDENNYFLTFNDSKESRYDEFPDLGIVIEKSYFGAIPSQKKERLFVPLKLDENGIAIYPKEEEFSSLLSDMSPVETKLHEVEVNALFKMKNSTEFSSVELTIESTLNTKIICIIDSTTTKLMIEHKNIRYIGYDDNTAKIKELANKLGLSEKHPIQKCDSVLQEASEKGFFYEEYSDNEVSEMMIQWMMENVKQGSHDAIGKFKAMALSGRGKLDIDNEIFQSFFNTYSDKIKKSKSIKLKFLCDEVEMKSI